MFNSKYKLKSPIITPEYFPLAYKKSEDRINSLAVYSDIKKPPTIIFDHIDSTIDSMFPEDHCTNVYLPNGGIMVLNPLLQWQTSEPNFVATLYLNMLTSTFQGDIFTDTVYGDVLLFSNFDVLYGQHSLSSYSISYETVQELLTLYVKHKQNFKTN
jgi:hypothetical protein